jgi:hypothetical protein
MPTVYDRLKTLQITMPNVPPPVVDGYVAAFVPFVRTGNLIHFSGRLAKKDGELWVGKLGLILTSPGPIPPTAGPGPTLKAPTLLWLALRNSDRRRRPLEF